MGHVQEVGEGVTRAIGSRVMCIVGGGAYAEYVVASDNLSDLKHEHLLSALNPQDTNR